MTYFEKIKQQTNKECSKADILKKMEIKLEQRISLGSSSFEIFPCLAWSLNFFNKKVHNLQFLKISGWQVWKYL